jgi:HSP20 family protein
VTSVKKKNCGLVLRQLRQKFGSISISELARILGVSRSTVMRIERGQTRPSEEFLNRLKALQLIGISKFNALSTDHQVRFQELLKEMGEDPDVFIQTTNNGTFNTLTPTGILSGLGAIAAAALNRTTPVITSISVFSSMAGYGLIKGLQAILEANHLSCVENEGQWDIITTTESKGTSLEREDQEMAERRENRRTNGDVGFDFGLGGLFKGLGHLIDSASKLAEKGEEISKSGEIDFSGLDKIKGLKDLKGVYGVRVRTMADGRPSVQPFGNIRRSPKGPVVEEVREPIVDVFEEGQKIQIIAEMPGIEENDIEVNINGDILTINAAGEKRKYQKEVLLSRPCKAEGMTWGYKNGILEIKILCDKEPESRESVETQREK